MTGGGRRSRLSAVLFDLDGTLLDTRSGVSAAVECALSEVLGGDTGRSGIDWSLPLPSLVAALAPDASRETRTAITGAFLRHYDSGLWERAVPMDGAERCLAALAAAGLRLFVVTNKRQSAAARLVAHFGLAAHLEGVVGQADDGGPAPKSELAGRCITAYGLDPGACAVVGDSDHDAAMASAWRMPFIAVTSGTGPLTRSPASGGPVEVVSLADAAAYLLQPSQRR